MPETKTPETMARLRHHRTSPTKVRQVLRLIVGKDVANRARHCASASAVRRRR